MIETIYKCDAPGCGEATTDPKGWWQVGSRYLVNGWIELGTFAKDDGINGARIFCGINHALCYISSIAPELQKEAK